SRRSLLTTICRRFVLVSALVPRLTFVPVAAVALISRLAFISTRTCDAWGNACFKNFDFDVDLFRFHVWDSPCFGRNPAGISLGRTQVPVSDCDKNVVGLGLADKSRFWASQLVLPKWFAKVS